MANDIDLLKVKEVALSLLKNVEGLGKRYFAASLVLGTEPRIKVLRGFRGTGKTTALLQMMGALEKSIYFSADHPYAEEYGIYELGKALLKSGYTTLLIDEVHYAPSWKSETKALYDEFSSAKLVLSGSAPLAFERERRYEVIEVEPLSCREFAELGGTKIAPTESWRSADAAVEFIASNSGIYEAYGRYLEGGGFPIFFTYGAKTLNAIYGSIRKSVREDSAFFSSVDGGMINGMERLLIALATAQLGDFSINSMSKHLELTKYRTYEIVALLEGMKILRLIRPDGKGPKLARGEPKLMFYHPNMRSSVCGILGVKPQAGAIREELAVFSLVSRGWKVNTIKGMKKSPDYVIGKAGERIVVEIGGPSKKRAQLAGFENSLVIDERQLIALSFF